MAGWTGQTDTGSGQTDKGSVMPERQCGSHLTQGRGTGRPKIKDR